MDKEVIFSVAGSGKTRYLIEKLSLSKRTLIIVYTRANLDNIRKRIVDKFGYEPTNISCYTYFSFLFSWGIKPYIFPERIKRIEFEKHPPRNRYKKESQYYLCGDAIFHNRLYDFLEHRGLATRLISRIERFFDEVLVDEVQDFAGNDFDFLIKLGQSSSLLLSYVGDFYQHIYDTSRNNSKNKNLHKDIQKYKSRFKGFTQMELSVCYRCPEAICKFISVSLGIPMIHNNKNKKHVEAPTLIKDKQKIKNIINDPHIPKLVYKKSETFNCWSINWGKSKGLEYDDVCVVLNKETARLYSQGKLSSLRPITLNKFYVACSRTKGNLYFIEEHHLPQKNTRADSD